jgi:Fur family ferric uptake transcriptional regulator
MVVTEPKSKDLESQCATKGMRMTEKRRIITRVLSGSNDHPDVEEHAHLVNLPTGEDIESQSEDIERSQAEIAKKLGYRLIDHRLELYTAPLDNKAKR